MAGEKSVQPFGEIGLKTMPLLSLQLRPTGGKEIGELGVDAQQIGMLPFLVIELVDQGANVGISFAHERMLDLDVYFKGGGGQTPEGILEPFPGRLSRLSPNGGEKGLGGELQV